MIPLEDIFDLMQLCISTMAKLKLNMGDYEENARDAYDTLVENWTKDSAGQLITLHERLLKSLSEVNSAATQMNLQFSLHRSFGMCADQKAEISATIDGNRKPSTIPKALRANVEDNGGSEPDGGAIKASEIDKRCKVTMSCLVRHKREYSEEGFARSIKYSSVESKEIAGTILPPIGGVQMNRIEAYNSLKKNIDSFQIRSLASGTLMHVNIDENILYVAKWDNEVLTRVLSGDFTLTKLYQLPNFGELLAFHDAQQNIFPRIVICRAYDEGGYDAYLVDYGEFLRLEGTEDFYELPLSIKNMPTEAVKCLINNTSILPELHIFDTVSLYICENNGHDLVATVIQECSKIKIEEMEDKNKLSGPTASANETLPNSSLVKQECDLRDESSLHKRTELKLNEREWAEFNEMNDGTSDALEAVLGFKPKDEERLCRHYNPKHNGCFKGANCHLVHERFAPHGATKDMEVTTSYVDSVYIPTDMSKIQRLLVTYIKTPKHLYVQFVDDSSSPLMWAKNEISLEQFDFKSMPLPFDIVLALYQDGNYYRARIIEENSLDGIYKVFFMDYGNTELVTFDSMAVCSSVYSLIPQRAVSCTVEGIVCHPKPSWKRDKKCLELLNQILLNMEIDAEMVGTTPDGYIIKFIGDYEYIPGLLIEKKYVLKHEPPNVCRSKTSSSSAEW